MIADIFVPIFFLVSAESTTARTGTKLGGLDKDTDEDNDKDGNREQCKQYLYRRGAEPTS